MHLGLFADLGMGAHLRRRSAILEALELLREAAPTLSLAQLISFLHVADEQDPLPLPDLQRRAEISGVQAWRTVQALAEPPGRAEPLVIVSRWKMGGITAVRRTAAGTALCEALDEILLDAAPIATQGEPPAPAGAGRGAYSAPEALRR